jgi:hypothetical protein
MSCLLFCALPAAWAFAATTTHTLPVTYTKVYGEPLPGYVKLLDDAPRTPPRSPLLAALDAQPPAVQQGGRLSWPELAMLGLAGAILAGGLAFQRRGWRASSAVAGPDLESAAIASQIATLAVSGETSAAFGTRRDALLAGAAGIFASLPFAASAEDAAADPAPAEEAPPSAAPAKPRGMFDAPARKADQSKVGVSRVKVPKQGEGSPGAQIPPAKIYTAWEGKTSVFGPNGAGDAAPNGSGPPRGPFDGGETKPKSDFLAAKTK